MKKNGQLNSRFQNVSQYPICRGIVSYCMCVWLCICVSHCLDAQTIAFARAWALSFLAGETSRTARRVMLSHKFGKRTPEIRRLFVDYLWLPQFEIWRDLMRSVDRLTHSNESGTCWLVDHVCNCPLGLRLGGTQASQQAESWWVHVFVSTCQHA